MYNPNSFCSFNHLVRFPVFTWESKRAESTMASAGLCEPWHQSSSTNLHPVSLPKWAHENSWLSSWWWEGKKNRQFGLHFLLTPCFKLVCLDILDGKDLGQKVSCSVMQGKQLKKYPWGTWATAPILRWKPHVFTVSQPALSFWKNAI